MFSHDVNITAAALIRAGLYPVTLRELETAAIKNALSLAHGNEAQAAKSLKISVRALQRKMMRWSEE